MVFGQSTAPWGNSENLCGISELNNTITRTSPDTVRIAHWARKTLIGHENVAVLQWGD
jgi:hypothetical protein